MHRHQALSNTQQRINPWIGGKRPLNHDLQKTEPPTFPSGNVLAPGSMNNNIDEDQHVYPNRNYYSGKQARTNGKAIRNGKGIRNGKAIRNGEPPDDDNPLTIENIRQGNSLALSKLPFLWKLHQLLTDVESTGDDHIVSWLDHGRAFRVHKPNAFVQKIIPHYFKQSHYKSFQRQLHLYEFMRTKRGPNTGAYSHPKFIRGDKSLCLSLSPKKIKGKYSKTEHTKDASAAMENVPCDIIAAEPNVISSSIYSSITQVGGEAPESESFKLDGGMTESYIQLMEDDIAFVSDECKQQDGGCNAAQWGDMMTKRLREMLVTGSSLAAELEEKGRTGDCAVPHQGDVVYVFGGMPFRYIEHANNTTGLMEEAEDDLIIDEYLLSEYGDENIESFAV